MPSPNVTHIKDAYIEYANRGLGEIKRLYEHQLRSMESDADVLVLDAPTGSGKTLAALARVTELNQSSIFVYPTNTLVKNQVTAITDLLDKLGYASNVIGEDSEGLQDRFENTDIDVIHITGDTLEVLADGEAKGSIIDEVLMGTHKPGRLRLLLTNPDTLYLAFSGKYHRHGRITEQIFTFQTVVVDEFHLYSGPTLAKVFFLLNYLRADPENSWMDLIFLSATHGDTCRLLRNTYPNLDWIEIKTQSCSSSDNRRIRCHTTCEMKTKNSVMFRDSEAENAAEKIVEYYMKELPSEPQNLDVKVLGVFSSVVFALKVARKVAERIEALGFPVEDTVHQIHGLIPRQERPKLEDLDDAILIGTSAIEVGIDFDVPYLVMEAHDLASFLQRFGRGGRHQECESLLYLPQPMVDRITKSDYWEFEEFLRQASESFLQLPSYAGFMTSRQSRTILLALALAGSSKPYTREVQFDYSTAADNFVRLVEANENVKVDDLSLFEIIGSLDRDDVLFDLHHRTVETLAKFGFLRGAMNSIPTIYSGDLVGSQSDEIISEIDILDLLRMSGNLARAEDYWDSIPGKIKNRRNRSDPLFLADGLQKQGYPQVRISESAPHRNQTGVYMKSDIWIRGRGSRMNSIADSVLDRRNLAYYWRGITRRTDYRIPFVYADGEPGGLVIGDWALVAEYLDERRKQEDAGL